MCTHTHIPSPGKTYEATPRHFADTDMIIHVEPMCRWSGLLQMYSLAFQEEIPQNILLSTLHPISSTPHPLRPLAWLLWEKQSTVY